LQRVQADGLPIYQFEMWNSAPFCHGVFTRHGGVSHGPWDSLNVGGTVGDEVENVAENHRRLYTSLGLDPARACSVWQVHGADTVIATTPPQNRRWLNRADGMVTNQRGLPLMMRFADCVPILFYDPVQTVVGIAHAGWRGTLNGAQVSVVETMQQAFGCRPQDIQAGIGPSIGPEAYQVGEEVVAEVQHVLGTTEGIISRAEDGSAYFDLWEANRRILANAGLEQIEVAGISTAQRTDDFFSHRAEKGRTGRFGAVIAL
jgi:YfiH family protein